MNSLPDYLSVRATTLEEAWSRFDPQTPLPVGSPFYVEREDNPLGRLQRGLLLVKSRPPKYFFAGHRGSGKSTELNRLVAALQIKERYWPVKFSVRDMCDLNYLTHVEVLLAIGGQIVNQYTAGGGRIKDSLSVRLEGWQGRIVERLKSKHIEIDSGIGLDIGKFFLSALLKAKREQYTREIVHQEIGASLSELIEIINEISTEVLVQSKRQVLIVVDDMDKPPLHISRKLFEDGFTSLTQPTCAITYTVPVAIYFDPAFAQMRDCSYFLPNIKLHERGQHGQSHASGVRTMRHCVLARMDNDLITREALDEAVRASGGVFREIAHIVQLAIDHALAHDNACVQMDGVTWAADQIRSSFWRLLNDEAYRLLLDVRATNEIRQPDRLGPLFHLLAVLEYTNGENWCDVHPVLDRMLDKIAPTLATEGD